MATIRDFEVHAEEEEDEEGDLGLERTHTLRKHTKVHRGSVLAGSVAGFGENLGDITGMELEYGSSAAPTRSKNTRGQRGSVIGGGNLGRLEGGGMLDEGAAGGSISRRNRGSVLHVSGAGFGAFELDDGLDDEGMEATAAPSGNRARGARGSVIRVAGGGMGGMDLSDGLDEGDEEGTAAPSRGARGKVMTMGGGFGGLGGLEELTETEEVTPRTAWPATARGKGALSARGGGALSGLALSDSPSAAAGRGNRGTRRVEVPQPRAPPFASRSFGPCSC